MEGSETLECRLKNALSHIEPVTIFMDDLGFIEDTNLNYNTYPISVQINEKNELIKHYEDVLDQKIYKIFGYMSVISKKKLIEFLYRFFKFQSDSNDNPEFNSETIVRFIQQTRMTEIFFLEKFNRALTGLKVMSRKETKELTNREEEAKKREADMKRREELYRKVARIIKIAAHQKKDEKRKEAVWKHKKGLFRKMAQTVKKAANIERREQARKSARKSAKKEREELDKRAKAEEERIRQEKERIRLEEERRAREERKKEDNELLTMLGFTRENTIRAKERENRSRIHSNTLKKEHSKKKSTSRRTVG